MLTATLTSHDSSKNDRLVHKGVSDRKFLRLQLCGDPHDTTDRERSLPIHRRQASHTHIFYREDGRYLQVAAACASVLLCAPSTRDCLLVATTPFARGMIQSCLVLFNNNNPTANLYRTQHETAYTVTKPLRRIDRYNTCLCAYFPSFCRPGAWEQLTILGDMACMKLQCEVAALRLCVGLFPR
jgi:hypothetical protein